MANAAAFKMPKDIEDILTSDSLKEVAEIGARLTFEWLSDSNIKSAFVIPFYMDRNVIRNVQYLKLYLEELALKYKERGVLLCKSSNTLKLNNTPSNLTECNMHSSANDEAYKQREYELYIIEGLNINTKTRIHKKQKETIDLSKAYNKKILYTFDPHTNPLYYIRNLKILNKIDPDIKWFSLLPEEG